ncbi:Bax inhibitor-1/YccA family protein [Runella sp.]|uniref:Bax inhibitor-1/YccA family protein n=1 Tax=Runella sp. TaxID=1960881 RepID=UPI003D0E77C3
MKNAAVSEEIHFTTNVFGWMAAGLMVSGFISFKLLQNYYLVQSITSNYIVLSALIIGQLGFVVWISFNLEKMASSNIGPLFLGFSILNGLLLPLIFQFFTENYIISTFFILAGMFLIMSAFGYFTKRNLTSRGNLLLLVFVGILLNVWLNVIGKYDQFQFITSCIAVAVFAGITAYDSKRIKEMNDKVGTDKSHQIAAVMGAFALYLDLYYLFLAIVFAVNKRDKKSGS